MQAENFDQQEFLHKFHIKASRNFHELELRLWCQKIFTIDLGRYAVKYMVQYTTRQYGLNFEDSPERSTALTAGISPIQSDIKFGY
jgi:hypothetical protein